MSLQRDLQQVVMPVVDVNSSVEDWSACLRMGFRGIPVFASRRGVMLQNRRWSGFLFLDPQVSQLIVRRYFWKIAGQDGQEENAGWSATKHWQHNSFLRASVS